MIVISICKDKAVYLAPLDAPLAFNYQTEIFLAYNANKPISIIAEFVN